MPDRLEAILLNSRILMDSITTKILPSFPSWNSIPACRAVQRIIVPDIIPRGKRGQTDRFCVMNPAPSLPVIPLQKERAVTKHPSTWPHPVTDSGYGRQSDADNSVPFIHLPSARRMETCCRMSARLLAIHGTRSWGIPSAPTPTSRSICRTAGSSAPLPCISSRVLIRIHI